LQVTPARAARHYVGMRGAPLERVIDFAPAPRPDPSRGLVETLLVIDGHGVLWRRHRERLHASARALYGTEPGHGTDRAVARAAERHPLARMRVRAVPGRDGELAVTAEAEPIDAGIVLGDGDPDLALVRVSRGFGRHKLLDRRWLEKLESSVPRGARPLLVSTDDHVLETTRANVIALRGGELETPALDDQILPGVMRAVVTEQARRAGLVVREGRLGLDALRAADSILLTGSVRLLERRRMRKDPRSEAALSAIVEGVRAAVGWPSRGGPT
jgi:branched-subunit amino acid aminotransferase/4-amino-4-deoxychorismate lyase